jgi:quercetin dioxygenase-like cupin family protein
MPDQAATREGEPVANLVDLATLQPFDVWGDDVRARRVEGERITFAVVELAPNSVVPQHRHPQEQVGMVIEGRVTFTIADETRELGPGGTWRILSNVPHMVVTGPDGATVIDTFAPTRDDWTYPLQEPRRPNWPRR